MSDNDDTFTIGDVVRLRSGGPAMTIESFADDDCDDDADDEVTCVFFAPTLIDDAVTWSELQRETFELSTLEKLSP